MRDPALGSGLKGVARDPRGVAGNAREALVDVLVLLGILVACMAGRHLFDGRTLSVLAHPWIYAWAALMVCILALTKTFFPRCEDAIFASAVMNSMGLLMSPARSLLGLP